ncbi:MAG: diguanylate cyclase [Candidatus Adiutrix sp.]|jgi:diguanylate cyclase|nr:diguanylate cyclase [Candidatus Adiutrix sp.]
MAAKENLNNIELEKSATYLLESLGDILAAGGPSFEAARQELERLIASSKVIEPDALKRSAYALSNVVDEIGRRGGGASLEVKEGRSLEVRDGGGLDVRSEEKAAPAQEVCLITAPLADLLISAINQVSSIRPKQYDDAAQGLIALIKTDTPLEDIIRNLLDFIIKIRDDLWEERSRAYKQIGEILKNLENAEEAFIGSVSASQSHLTASEQSFTTAMETGLREIGSMVENGPADLEHLCGRLSEKVMKLNDCVQRKKAADQTRLETLDAVRVQAEQKLEKSRRDYEAFTKQSSEMIQEIENLRAVSLRDPLTGIYNRRAYDSQIVKALEAVSSGSLRTCALAVFDIDYFRDFNNAYGHLAGDRVLAYVARLTRETLRSDDLVFRYGGDEFVILMPNVTIQAALGVAEKVRKSITSVEFKLFKNNELTVAVTISVGVAELRPGDGPAEFFARADQAMYQAKSAGRNQVSSGEAQA